MSNKLSWFSGGGERSQEAVVIIDALVSDLASQPTTEPLKQVLNHYRVELVKRESSVPMILSRMNLDVARILTQNGIVLSTSQSSQLKAITALSNIRYGY